MADAPDIPDLIPHQFYTLKDGSVMFKTGAPKIELVDCKWLYYIERAMDIKDKYGKYASPWWRYDFISDKGLVHISCQLLCDLKRFVLLVQP